jgi:hypothetical protein
MRFRGWARSCRLGTVSYTIHPPQCGSLPSFSIKWATDLRILKNGANILGSVAEPGAEDKASNTIHPPQSVVLYPFLVWNRPLTSDSQEWFQYMRFCSWARSCRLGFQYGTIYPSVCCSLPSFSVKLGDWPADSQEWCQYMRLHSLARSCRLGIQKYPPTSVCCSLLSFSIKLGDWPADSQEWCQYMRSRSWARSCRLGIQYYPTT